MRLKFESRLDDEDQLPTDLNDDDVGRTWFVGYIWFIWTGRSWQRVVATRQPRP